MPERKTAAEHIAMIEDKIAKKKAQIDELEAQKQKLLHPKSAKTKEADPTPEELGE